MKTVQAYYGSRCIFQNTQFGAAPLVSKNVPQLILFVVCSIVILNTPKCHQLDCQNLNRYLGWVLNASVPNMWTCHQVCIIGTIETRPGVNCAGVCSPQAKTV